MKKNFFVVWVQILFLFSCSGDEERPGDFNNLENLPKDTGGLHTPFLKDATSAPYGFFVYAPGGYSEEGPEYPLLIFLHGAGERGNSQINPNVLNLVLRNGPPKLIQKGNWAPKYPMIVASPQCETWWDAEKIHTFIKFLIDNYQVNEKRIYVTGISMGGYGTFGYATLGKESFAAAMVPICGGGNANLSDKMAELPIWAFHGLADNIVLASNSVSLVNAINSHNPPVKAKLTLYPGVGYDSWTMTYDGTGMGKESSDYDPFDMSIYDWLFQYEKQIAE